MNILEIKFLDKKDKKITEKRAKRIPMLEYKDRDTHDMCWICNKNFIKRRITDTEYLLRHFDFCKENYWVTNYFSDEFIGFATLNEAYTYIINFMNNKDTICQK